MSSNSFSNPQIANMGNAFAQVTTDGTQFHKFSHTDSNPVTHIQGMGYYGDDLVFTHNQTDGPGYFVFGDLKTGKAKEFDAASPSGLHHPGGMQVVGDYMVVGIEPNESDNSRSAVQFYDIGKVKSGGSPTLMTSLGFTRSDGGAAACGMTYANGRYVLCVYTSHDSQVHVYVSSRGTLNDAGLTFQSDPKTSPTPVMSFQARDSDGNGVGYDSVAMFTDSAGKTYLVGLRGESNKLDTHVTDYAELIAIDVDKKTQSTLSTRHFDCKSTGGVIGVHFRYGATVATRDGQSLLVLASARHFELTGTPLNRFGDLPNA